MQGFCNSLGLQIRIVEEEYRAHQVLDKESRGLHITDCHKKTRMRVTILSQKS